MTGVLLAIVALFGWGIADFFVQKTTRKVGIATTMLASGVLGLVVLTPFVYKDFGRLAEPRNLILLGAYALIGIVTGLFSLEAFRKGKLAVIEPILGIELPITILLAVGLHDERLDAAQVVTVAAIFLGVLLTATRQLSGLLKRRSFEKGVLLGLAGAVSLGVGNFITGVASQEAGALLTVWAGRLVFTAAFGGFLFFSGRLTASYRAARDHAGLVFGVSALYLAAFVSYGIATTLIPISIATTISENYVILGVLLGVFINKEKLMRHQKFGVALAFMGLLALAYMAA